MIRFRTLLCAASAACGLTLGFGAPAQTITSIALPSGGCVVTGTTLDCTGGGGGGVASCSISGQTTAVVGDTVTLTGSCVAASGANDPSLSWTGCGTAQGSTCTLTSSGTVTLTGGAGGSKSKTVTFGAATCNISPSNPSVISGNSQTFSASCNFTPTSYSWTGCSSSQASCTLTPTVPGTVSVTASNSNSSASASTSYTIGSAGGGGTIPGKCDDGNSSVAFSPISIFNGVTIQKTISNSQTAVIPIVVPPAGISKFQLVLFTFNPDNTRRDVWLSKTACFTPTAVRTSKLVNGTSTGAQIGYQLSGGGTFNVTVGSPSGVTLSGGNPSSIVMSPGETWYLMVENDVAAGGCISGSCAVAITPNQVN